MATPHTRARAVPGPPAAATVTTWSGTELFTQFVPPLSDGGSQVTGYRIDWDTNPGNFEVQTLTTTPNLGPNEIQSLTLSATHIPEVQSFVTTAAVVPEVQTVTTFADINEQLGGSFTLAFDTTAMGGGYYVSAQIPAAAAAQAGSPPTRESMQEILEAMPNIFNVSVSRAGPDEQGGYTWSITFYGPPGNLPQLQLASMSLTGNGAGVLIDTPVPGNQISGFFRIGFGYEVTAPLAYDATPGDVQAAMEQLVEVGVVEVTRSGPDVQRGYGWTVTFVDNMNSGRVAPITIDASALTTLEGSPNVTLCVGGVLVPGSPCALPGSSVPGNQFTGTFNVTFTAPVDGMGGGGGSATVYGIPVNASASLFETMVEAIAGNVTGNISVTRTGPDLQQGYSWTVTFLSAMGGVPSFGAQVTGTAVGAVATTVHLSPGTLQEVQHVVLDGVTGNITGNFTLTFNGISTLPIPLAMGGPTGCAPIGANVQYYLDQLQTVNNVTVTATTVTFGCLLNVTFVGNAGNVPLLVANSSTPWSTATTVATAGLSTSTGGALLTPSSAITVSTLRNGNSSVLGGTFTVSFNGDTTGYLSFDSTAEQMQDALEALESVGQVTVTRSDVDVNNGYTWTVTFTTELGNLPLMSMDVIAMTGTLPEGLVSKFIPGMAPPFNSGTGGLALGSVIVTDMDNLQFDITGLRQGVFYSVRVSAANAVGYGDPVIASPPFIAPWPQPPTEPTNVSLAVLDGNSVSVSWSDPVRLGGEPLFSYLIEWYNQQLVPEVQSVLLTTPVVNEVQVVTTTPPTGSFEVRCLCECLCLCVCFVCLRVCAAVMPRSRPVLCVCAPAGGVLDPQRHIGGECGGGADHHV